MTIRRAVQDTNRVMRDPPAEVVKRTTDTLREITIAWASITEADLEIGELVFNHNDDSLVFRSGSTIWRFDNNATGSV